MATNDTSGTGDHEALGLACSGEPSTLQSERAANVERGLCALDRNTPRLDVGGFLQDAATEAEFLLNDLYDTGLDWTDDGVAWDVQNAARDFMAAIDRFREHCAESVTAEKPDGPSNSERL